MEVGGEGDREGSRGRQGRGIAKYGREGRGLGR